MNAIGPVVDVEVTGDGAGVTNQAGTRLLGEIANQLGVTCGLSQALASTTSRSSAHDRGRMLVQLAMMIAVGGRAVSDLATLRDRPELFGPLASDATAWRACHQLDDERLADLVEVRQRACRRLLAGRDGPLVLDVDATLLNLHGEGKQGAAATFKGTYGFAAMACFIEPLGLAAGMLRPGNATANGPGPGPATSSTPTNDYYASPPSTPEPDRPRRGPAGPPTRAAHNPCHAVPGQHRHP